MLKCEIKDFLMSFGEYVNVPCKVPCSLYSVALDNGYIEDPYYRTNFIDGSSLLGECSFKSTFRLEAAVVNSKYVYLFLDGIMANAELVLNGKSFGFLSDPNKIYTIDVADAVVEGDNLLEIKCKSPIIPHKPIHGHRDIDTPTIPDMGIVGRVELKASSRGIISGVGVVQTHSEGKVTLGINMSTLGAVEDMSAVITLASPLGKLYFGSVIGGRGHVTVPDPALWWPRTLGTPHLYNLSVTLYHHGEAEDSFEFKVGLCEILVSCEDGKEKITVNGKDILALGAEYTVGELLMPYATPQRCEELIKIAVESNFNTLKVGYSDLYPPEYFFNLCDKYGIIAWQDLYTRYKSGADNVPFTMMFSADTSSVVERILRHPSAVISNLHVTVPKDADEKPAEGAVAEFVDSCKRIIEPVYEFYAPSGKLTFDGEGIFDCDELHKSGGLDPLGIPDIGTVKSFAEDEDLNLFSAVMESHTESKHLTGAFLESLSRSFRYPNGLSELSYVSQLSAALNFREAIYKMRSGEGKSKCAVLRKFNDVWPSVSASRVDFYGKKKALCYECKRVFAPVIATVEINGCEVKYSVSCHSQKPYSGRLTFALYDCNDRCLTETTKAVYAEPMSSVEVELADYSKYVGGTPEEYYVIFELANERFTDYVGCKTFAPPKHFKFRNPEIKYSVSGSGKEFEISLLSSAYAMGVQLDFGDIDVELSDNFVDLREGVAEKLTARTDRAISPEKLQRALRLRSVYDIGKYKSK